MCGPARRKELEDPPGQFTLTKASPSHGEVLVRINCLGGSSIIGSPIWRINHGSHKRAH